MTTQLDSSIGYKKEATFGTAVAVDKFLEFNTEDFAWVPTFSQSAAQRYGRRVDAADRRVLTKSEVSGSVEIDILAKGLGALFEAALGAGTSTQLAATDGYQQLFKLAATDFLPSYTFQKGLPPLGGGAATAQTFAGMVCTGFDLTVGNAALPSLKFNFIGKGVDTTTALAVSSYIADNELLSFTNASLRVGGAVTVPTGTTLATGGTEAANVRDINFTLDNGLDSNGFNVGGAGKRTRKHALGLRKGTGTLTAEYDSNVLRDAYLNQEDLALVLDFTSTVPIDTDVYPTLELVIPNIRLEGELPKANGGDVIAQSIGFTMLDGRVAAEPLYVAIVTGETAI